MPREEFSVGKRFGAGELRQLAEALDQNTLFYAQGRKVKKLVEEFKRIMGVKWCAAASSGTASIHAALGAAGVSPGDEVITSPITDMGTVIPILFQGAIPVFADVDPNNGNMTPESVEAAITDRTRAVVLVHLAGNPARADKIYSLCRKRGIILIEDCAQSIHTRYKGRFVGAYGDMGAFSLNDFKHISTGDGGLVVARTKKFGELLPLFADKYYDRSGRGIAVELLANNYRMTELQGAVGLEQLRKLNSITRRRHELGETLARSIEGIEGVYPPKRLPGAEATYWFFMFTIDPKQLGCSRDEFAARIRSRGVPVSSGYIPRPVYLQPIFTNKKAFERTMFPLVNPFNPRKPRYCPGLCPNAELLLSRAVRMPINEAFTRSEINKMIKAVHWAAK